MDFFLLRNKNELDDLSSVWNELLVQSEVNHIHSGFEWLSTWWKYFGEGKELFVVLVKDDDEIIGIAPLMIHNVSKFYSNTLVFRQLTFLGRGFADSAGFIFKKGREDIIPKLMDFLYKHKNLWDEIHLTQMDNSTKSFKILNEGFSEEFTNHTDYVIGCPYLDINQDFDAYNKKLSRSLRNKVERYRKKLESEGETKYVIEYGFTQKLIDEIVRLNQMRNIKFGRKSPFLDPVKKAFIRDVFNKLSNKDQVRIFTIRQCEYLLIYSITFSYNNTISRWNTCYNLNYSKYSLGKILTKYILKYCYENNYKKCDWMAGVEEHKLHWTKELRENHSLTVKKKNIKTSIADSYRTIKKYARKYEFIQ